MLGSSPTLGGCGVSLPCYAKCHHHPVTSSLPMGGGGGGGEGGILAWYYPVTVHHLGLIHPNFPNAMFDISSSIMSSLINFKRNSEGIAFSPLAVKQPDIASSYCSFEICCHIDIAITAS